jgi:hypothetical protein
MAVGGESGRPSQGGFGLHSNLLVLAQNQSLTEGHHELVGGVAFAAWLRIHAALLTVARARFETLIE